MNWYQKHMGYMATTFAYGNGPYSRCVEWAIAINDVREERSLSRLPIVVPLVYPGRQERILREEIETTVSPDFLREHPTEIFFDVKHGELLSRVMFQGANYSENLELLVRDYQKIEDSIQKHLDGNRVVKTFEGIGTDARIVTSFDMRDAELQLGLNNRMQTGLPNQFYTTGGAGPFDELLEKAINNKRIKTDKGIMKKVIPIAKRMIENQEIIFSNEPGVFSYDYLRVFGDNEMLTPPFIHSPKPDDTELPGKGVYLLMTGIDGIRESGMYSVVVDLGMQLFAPVFSIKNLPESVRNKVIELAPSKINNPNIVAQYARAGWSSVWLSHLAEKGFLTPPYQEKDDPEMLFNESGIQRLGLGAIMGDDPRVALEKAIELAEGTKNYNQILSNKYGTLDGIKYSAEIVANSMWH